MDKQRNQSVEDGVKCVEAQLPNFIEESGKLMDQIEENKRVMTQKWWKLRITLDVSKSYCYEWIARVRSSVFMEGRS